MEKLVRDRIPEAMALNDEIAAYRKETDIAEYRLALLYKLLEEGMDLVRVSDVEETKAKIADVMEVLEAVVDFYGFSKEDIRKVKAERLETYGGFAEGIMLITKEKK